jgi:uncharacterized membrane protein YgcG
VTRPRYAGRVARAVATVALALALASPATAADGGIVDDQGFLDPTYRGSVEAVIDAYEQLTSGRFLVVLRAVDAADGAAAQREAARRHASEPGPAIVLVVDAPSDDGCPGGTGIATTTTGQGAVTTEEAGFVAADLADSLRSCQLGPGVAIASARLLSFAITDEEVSPAASLEPGASLGPGGFPIPSPGGGDPPGAPPPGPPFPDPVEDQAVYDFARVFKPATIASAEATIDAIEARTGAEVAIYTQVVDYEVSTEEAHAHAAALMDQWGVGRKGIDDGLVILFDLDPTREHGQVSLYGGPGYLATYLDNGEKQKLFDEEMLPRLRAADLDGALLMALEGIDANATPAHAARLQAARQIDAAAGLIGAPILFVGLVGSAMFAWVRYGRDPIYLDDASIHMAGPPQDLTPASGTYMIAGAPTRRALTAAMLDLASRGLIAFREEKGFLGLGRKVGVVMNPSTTDPETVARHARNAARRLGTAEQLAFKYLDALKKDDEGYIEPDELLAFGTRVEGFNNELEDHVVERGWFREKPSKAQGRWAVRGTAAIVAGVVAFIGAVNLPSGGLTLIAVALIGGGVLVLVMSRWMQAVSLPGAMIRAMLAAYRRTLRKTMDQARSMNQVVAEAGLSWLHTPDQVVVWGTALGLEKEIEGVLERSLDDVRDGRSPASSTYLPAWYGTGSGDGAGFAAGGGGLFSSSAVPDFGGMMSALGTIGNAPSSSGSGGGFGGGSSGGGGGGSGGGF